MSMPRSAAFARTERRSAFADDVATSLMETPRRVSSRFLYDALGSALFDAICELPWYRVTRAEQGLLERHGAAVLSAAGPVGRVVELGAGSGAKLATLLRQRGHTGTPRVSLIDVSGAALAAAARAVGQIPGLGPITQYQATYDQGLQSVAQETAVSGPTLLLLLGSNLGNFDPDEGQQLLTMIRQALRPGDQFLIGNDLIKPEATLQLAYDDPLGVTAAFNLNVFVRMNRELEANFDLQQLTHVAIWNAEAARMEMHAESRCRQTVTIPAAGLQFTLERGERIWTESSHKYTVDTMTPLLATAGFRQAHQWVDHDAGFALTLASVI